MGRIFKNWRNLSITEKISSSLILLILATLPISVVSVFSPKQFRRSSAASPILPPDRILTSTPLEGNNMPNLEKKNIGDGSVGDNYQISISGYDRDVGDQLSVKFYNLPEWMSTECFERDTTEQSIVTCALEGVPDSSGFYNFTASISDGTNTGDTENYSFTVK